MKLSRQQGCFCCATKHVVHHQLTKHNFIASFMMNAIMQVRQRLYNSSVGKWKLHETYMQPAADLLDPMVKRYEEEYAVFFINRNPEKSVKDEL
jgi:hypothetical protein